MLTAAIAERLGEPAVVRSETCQGPGRLRPAGVVGALSKAWSNKQTPRRANLVLARGSEPAIVAKLELAFEEAALREVCEREAKAQERFGFRVAETLKHRLADLSAASCATDLVVGSPREIPDSEPPSMTIEVGVEYRILFCANHKKVPRLRSGATDWSKVKRVRLLGIVRSQ